MNIKLKKLTITNFKGIRNFETEFTHETNISGDNGTGKTTVFDAFLFLLFGKDSTDRQSFQMKPLDGQGNVIQKQDVEITGILQIDGEQVTLKRVFREKWTKKRGDAETTFTGNETLYYWNEVPMSAGDYANKVSGIVKENVFKLLTNTAYFNSMKWQDRREVLETLAGRITPDQVLERLTVNSKGDYSALINILNAGKSLVEYKAQLAAKRKLLKSNIDDIPPRIDEVNRQISTLNDIDFAGAKSKLNLLQAELTSIDSKLTDSNNANAERNATIRRLQDEVHKLHLSLKDIENQVRINSSKDSNELSAKITDLQHKSEINRREREQHMTIATRLKIDIENIESQMATLREEWTKVNGQTFQDPGEFSFDEHQRTCPTCKQSLPANVIEHKMHELKQQFDADKAKKLEQFNTRKAQELATINKRGTQLKADADGMKARSTDAQTKVALLDTNYSALQSELEQTVQQLNKVGKPTDESVLAMCATNPEYLLIKNKIEAKQAEISAPYAEADNSQLRERKSELFKLISEQQGVLANEKHLEDLQARRAKLNADLAEYSQQLANAEKEEFGILEYEKAKMDLLELRINGMFRYVTFKLFNHQINGGVEACCETLIKGVPFSDANNAARINAGLDIINALANHYQVWAPIFIDNAESVNQLIATTSQTIRLLVSYDKELKVA